MPSDPEKPPPWRWTRPWRGEGRAIEEAVVVVACASAGAVVAALLGLGPIAGALLAGGGALAAVLYRRR